ncbi:hypothetical protein [Gloeothece verrucosa]|uniref:Uncharacterized protein n=1 Tax=Gloeothece verrucosa (strain PCC 7822) TaxID=497965 RepID=E0U8Q3_GLOV7|nr:hypothetical protein [Gloeothece verrucosa]ADN14917.1 hypothetical protein Cyan7822_2960 [Gloeothece verrucosa PCC 7822]
MDKTDQQLTELIEILRQAIAIAKAMEGRGLGLATNEKSSYESRVEDLQNVLKFFVDRQLIVSFNKDR